MSDLISRQAAIDAVEKIKKWNAVDGEGYQAGLGLRYTDVIDTLTELPSAEKKVSQWIPCSERLPEDNGVYIVTTSIGQCQIHVFNKDGNSREYWTRCNKAWMPMPEAYEE